MPLPTSRHTHSRMRARRGTLTALKVKLIVGGETFDVVGGKEQREKTSVECNLDYEEKTLQAPADAEDVSSSIRYYHQAEAAIKNGEYEFKPVLRSRSGIDRAGDIATKIGVVFAEGDFDG